MSDANIKSAKKEITAKLKGIDQKSAVEKMVVYFAIGHLLSDMVSKEWKDGPSAMKEIVNLVPHLRDETRAREIMNLASDEQFMKFILEEAATPMNNGQHLTLWHWCRLHRNEPEEQPPHIRRKRPVAESDAKQNRADGGGIKRGEWRRRELEWLRKESPTASVLEHVETILEERHAREREELSDRVQEAIGMLEAL